MAASIRRTDHVGRKATRGCWPALVVAWAVIVAPIVRAHETDQYTVPAGRAFADLRLHFSAEFHDALTSAIDRINGRIDRSLDDRGQETPATAKLQSPDLLAWEVQIEFPPPLNQIELLNLDLTGPGVRDRYPGLVVGYQPAVWI